jgi:hypothetical protein
MIDGGKMTPRTDPPTTPHLRPVFVLCSVTLPRWTLPLASQLAMMTPSIFSGLLRPCRRSATVCSIRWSIAVAVKARRTTPAATRAHNLWTLDVSGIPA